MCSLQKKIDAERGALAVTLDELGESPPVTERKPKKAETETDGDIDTETDIAWSAGLDVPGRLPSLPPIHRSRSGSQPVSGGFFCAFCCVFVCFVVCWLF